MATIKNVGGIDRAIRIILGVVSLSLISLVFVGPQTRWAYLGFLGFIPLVTGIIGHCLVYKPLGINTHRDKGDD